MGRLPRGLQALSPAPPAFSPCSFVINTSSKTYYVHSGNKAQCDHSAGQKDSSHFDISFWMSSFASKTMGSALIMDSNRRQLRRSKPFRGIM